MAANPASSGRPQVGQAVRRDCPEVLIAEDEPNLRTLLRATLSGAYAVLEAPDGDRAWDLLRAHRPLVAVLDVQMPGRDGLELTRDQGRPGVGRDRRGPGDGAGCAGPDRGRPRGRGRRLPPEALLADRAARAHRRRAGCGAPAAARLAGWPG